MFGLCAVILGEDGMVWNMRIMNDGPLSRKYGYNETASAAAPAKVAEVIALIDARLKTQAENCSAYLVGDAVSAADIYWATMSMCVTCNATRHHACDSTEPRHAEVLCEQFEGTCDSRSPQPSN